MNSDIFNIIEKKKLDVISESIEKAHGLPNECYLNGPYKEIERKKIFEDKWVTDWCCKFATQSRRCQTF